MSKNKDIYLDGAANAPLDKRVFRAMKPFFKESCVGNSLSVHRNGQKAGVSVEYSRQKVLKGLGYDDEFHPAKAYFTSGATESNNWVIMSLALHEMELAIQDPNYKMKNRVILTSIEHASIMSACDELAKLGFEVIKIKPNKRYGSVSAAALRKVINDQTLLTCVMAVNNETGVKNQINLISPVAHSHGSYLLVDCTQAMAYGGESINFAKRFPKADYLTFSGHKIYGPLGTGCLIVNNEAPIYPYIHGGFQEDGLRGGTSNVPGIVGIGRAIELLSQENHEAHYEKLYKTLKNNLAYATINFEPDMKSIVSLKLSSHIKFPLQAVDILAMNGIACSAGSACHTEKEATIDDLFYSHVLTSLGFSQDDMLYTIRLSFTKYTTTKDIVKFCKTLIKIAECYSGDKNEHGSADN